MKNILLSLSALLLCLTTLGYTADASTQKSTEMQSADAKAQSADSQDMAKMQHIFTQLKEYADKLTAMPTKEDYIGAGKHLKEALSPIMEANPKGQPLKASQIIEALEAGTMLLQDESIPSGQKAAIYLLANQGFNEILMSLDHVDMTPNSNSPRDQ